jgi:SLT domain-containing protein
MRFGQTKMIKVLLEFFHSAINYHKRHYGPRFACGELAIYQLNASARAASNGGNYQAVA